MRKKAVIIISVIVCAVIAASVITILLHRTSQNANGICKYEWVQILSEKFEITDYQNSTPYYTDVVTDNPYFSVVQASYEWNVIPEEGTFEGSEEITGKYAAITAMKAIGPYKIKIYLDKSDFPTDDEYLELAIAEGLISKKELNKNVSDEMARELAENAYQLSIGKLFVDDYLKVEYASNVKELQDAEVVEIGEDSLITTESTANSLAVGDIIVFTNSNGLKTSKKINSITGSTVYLDNAELDETVESMVLSDIISFDSEEAFDRWFKSIESMEGVEVSRAPSYKVLPVSDMKKWENKGVKITISGNSDEAEVKFTNNNNNASTSVKVSGLAISESKLLKSESESKIFGKTVKKESTVGFEAEYELTDFVFGVQLETGTKQLSRSLLGISELPTIQHFVYQQQVTLKQTKKINGTVEGTIPLGSIQLVGNEKMAGIQIELSIIIAADGEASIITSVTPISCVEYRRGTLPREKLDRNENSDSEICCSLEADFEIKPSVKILDHDLLNTALDIGVKGEAKKIDRSKSDIIYCVDGKFSLPLISTSYTLFEDLPISFSDEKEWLNEDNAPFQAEIHYELYKNGTFEKVEECTYSDEYKVDPLPPHKYYAQFQSQFEQVDEHYEATGMLISQVYILEEDLKSLEKGQSFEFEGITFKVTDIVNPYVTVNGNDSDFLGDGRIYIFDDKYMIDTDSISEFSSERENYRFYCLCTIDSETMEQEQIGNTGDVWYFPQSDKYVYVDVSDFYTFKTEEYYEPYFISEINIDYTSWYYVSFTMGSEYWGYETSDPGYVDGLQGGNDDGFFESTIYIIK